MSVSGAVRDCLDQSYNFLIFSSPVPGPVHPRQITLTIVPSENGVKQNDQSTDQIEIEICKK